MKARRELSPDTGDWEAWGAFSRQVDGTLLTIPYGIAQGMAWKYRHSENSIYYALGVWDGWFQARLREVLAPGDVFYDVGAHEGFHSLIGARLVGRRGQVIAFEPEPAAAAHLRQQFAVNRLASCRIVRKAVSDVHGEATFYKHVEVTGLSSMLRPTSGTVERLQVPVTTLDRYARRSTAGPPAAIKIDVEGAEDRVLAGATGLMSSSSPPAFLIELHTPRSARASIEILKSHGYRTRLLFREKQLDELSPANIQHLFATHGGRGRRRSARGR